MKHAVCTALAALLLATACLAQTPDPQHHAMPMPGFNFEPPRALMGDWWRNPEIAAELHLTDAQRQQLEQASVNMKLSLIGAAANGAQGLVKAESDLNGQQMNEADYNQQVNGIADAASKLIKDVGSYMLQMRKILTPDQWQKLQAFRGRADRMRGMDAMPRRDEHRNPGGTVPRD